MKSKTDIFLYKNNIQDYIDFYNKLPKINKLKKESLLLKNNQDYLDLVFMKSKNIPALCHVEKFLDFIVLDRDYYTFYRYNPMFWMLPVETISGNIIGFILKGFSQKSYSWIHFSKISLLFGFYDFIDFKLNDPIVIVEGWRDCLYIKQFYKYSLALNTSSLNKGTLELLSKLTDKLVFILDNDQTGLVMTKVNMEMCIEKNIRCLSIRPSFKDLGEYFKDDRFKDDLLSDLKYAFEYLS